MASELLKGLFNRDAGEVKDRLRSGFQTALTVGGLGYAGYKSFQGSNIVEEVSRGVRSARGVSSEFNRVGTNLRNEMESLNNLKSNARKATLEQFSKDIDIKSIASAADVPIEDKRALFASLFDLMKSEGSGDLNAILKTGYDTGSLTDEQLAKLESSYNTLIKSNERNLETFKRKYSQLSKIKSTLTTSSGSVFTTLNNQVAMESFTSLGDTKLRATISDFDDFPSVQRRFNEIVSWAGGLNKVELVGFRDNNDKVNVRNLYVRVFDDKRNETGRIPLFLSRDKNGMVVIRATENSSTRYVAPQRVLNAPEIFDNVNLTSTRGGNLYSGPGSYSFEEYVHGRIGRAFGTFGGLANASKRDMMGFYEFLRSPGLDAPRGMLENFASITNSRGERFISEEFQRSMSFARTSQSSKFLIAGLESFDPALQQDLAKRLMQAFPDDVRGVGYPEISRLQDPFQRGVELSFTDIAMKNAPESPFNVMASYGRIDEIIQEQTAREFQMVGRYELAAGVKGIQNNARFGKRNSIKSFGSGGDLLGIADSAKRVYGVNLGAILLSSNVAGSAGFAEGQSYFGGQLEVRSSINKTVYDSGIESTKLFQLLSNIASQRKDHFITVGEGGDFTVKQFFEEFGDSQGRAVLGLSDEDVSAISRRKGIKRFTLGVTEISTEGGRRRAHISGEMSQYLDRTKMFSTIIKDTTTGISKEDLTKKLLGAGANQAEIDYFFNTLNVDIKQTLLASTEQLKKGPQFISSQIAGSLELFGIGKSLYFQGMGDLIGKDSDYLNEINTLFGKNYKDLELIGEVERKAGYLSAAVKTALNLIQNDGGDAATVGRVLGAAYDRSGKFFSKDQFENIVRGTLTKIDSNAALNEIKRGITFTAQYVSSGGVHTDYARNLAKVEPRFMNYLYTSLRTNFGLNEVDSTKFLGSFLARQEGAASRPQAILGMKLTSFGLSQMGSTDFENQLKLLSGVNTLTKTEALELINLGENESAVKSFLSERAGPQGLILDLNHLFPNAEKMDEIKKFTGGKNQIFLPGQDTLEAMRGFTISKSGENLNIESEFTRYITDLNASLGSMTDADSPTKFGYALSGFKAAKSSLARVSGLAIRNALTGRISGSGTYMGQGIGLGKTAEAATLIASGEGGLSHPNQAAVRQGLVDAFNQRFGYVLYKDSQAFLDSMSTYKQAMTDQLRLDKFAGGDELSIETEVEKRTAEVMRRFYFGMHGPKKEGAPYTVQRNPNIYFAHFMPGMEIFRYDFLEGENDPFLKLISESSGEPFELTEFTDAGKEEIRKRKKQLQFKKLRDLYGDRFAFADWDAFETARNTYYNNFKTLLEEKKRLQAITGVTVLNMGADGQPIKTPRMRTARKFNKFTGRYEDAGSTVVDGKFNFSIQSETLGTSTYPAERSAYYQTRGEIFQRIRGLRETLEASRRGILGAVEEDSPGSGQYKMVTKNFTMSETRLNESRVELQNIQARLSATSQGININTATEAELQTLKGIGPAKAKAILAYRATNQFSNITDLLNIKGISQGIVDNFGIPIRLVDPASESEIRLLEYRAKQLEEIINSATDSGKTTKDRTKLFDVSSTSKSRTILPGSFAFDQGRDLEEFIESKQNSVFFQDENGDIDLRYRTGLIDEDYKVASKNIERAKDSLKQIKSQVRFRREQNRKAIELAIKTTQITYKFDQSTGQFDSLVQSRFKTIFDAMGIPTNEISETEQRIGRPLALLRRSYKGLIQRQEKKLQKLLRRIPGAKIGDDKLIGREPFLSTGEDGKIQPIQLRKALYESELDELRLNFDSSSGGITPRVLLGQRDEYANPVLFNLLNSFTTRKEDRRFKTNEEMASTRYQRAIKAYNDHLANSDPKKPSYHNIEDFLIKTRKITPIGVALISDMSPRSKYPGEVKYFKDMERDEVDRYIMQGVQSGDEVKPKKGVKTPTVAKLLYQIGGEEGETVFFNFNSLNKIAKLTRKLERHNRLNKDYFSGIEQVLRGILGLESLHDELLDRSGSDIEIGDQKIRFDINEDDRVGSGGKIKRGSRRGYGSIQYTHRGITQGIISGALYNDLLEQVDALEKQRVQGDESYIDAAHRKLGVAFDELRLSLIGNEHPSNRNRIYDNIIKNFDEIKLRLLNPRKSSVYFRFERGELFLQDILDTIDLAEQEREAPGGRAGRKLAKLTRQLQGGKGGGVIGRIAAVERKIEEHAGRISRIEDEDELVNARKMGKTNQAYGLDLEGMERFKDPEYFGRAEYDRKAAELLEKRERLLARKEQLESLIKEAESGRIDLDFMRSYERDILLRDSDIRPVSYLQNRLNSTEYGRALNVFFGLNNPRSLANNGIETVRDFIENSEYRRTAFREEMTRRIAANPGSSPLIEYVRARGGDAAALTNYFNNGITYEEREVDDGKGGTKTIRVMRHPEIDAAQQKVNEAYQAQRDLIERGKKNREVIRGFKASQRVARDKALEEANTAYETGKAAEEERLKLLDEEFQRNPNRDEYEEARAKQKQIKGELEALKASEEGQLLAEIRGGKKPLLDELGNPVLDESGEPRFYNEQYKVTSEEDKAIRAAVGAIEGSGFKQGTGEFRGGKNQLFMALESMIGSKITSLEQIKNLSETRGSENITYGIGTKEAPAQRTETVSEAIDRLLLRGLSRHVSEGYVGGGIVYFPEIQIETYFEKNGKRILDTASKEMKYSGRMDFSRFSIGDFDADIYQTYHDTTRILTNRFAQNAESFHGLYSTGAEFLINMKELGRGMDEYGKRLGAGSLTRKQFQLDQYEKERILKSVGGLDVQIKVGMLGLAQASMEAEGDDAIREQFRRVRAGASLIAVAQESLVIKAKQLNIAADVGTEFLSAVKKSYSAGTGDAIYDFFDKNIFPGTIYQTEDDITLSDIRFLNIPEGEASKSLETSLKSIRLNKKELKPVFDLMASTVKKFGYHNLGSDTRLYRALEGGDAFSFKQMLSLLNATMEGGFTGEVNIDRVEEIMSAQRNIRETIGSNFSAAARKGGGYLAAAALGVGYIAGVKTSPEVLDSANKFSDMRAKQSIGGRHLYNMTTREHGNVSPSRFQEPLNMYDRPINMGETMVTKNSSMRMYGEAPTYSDAMMSARKVVGAGGNAFFSIQDGRMPISNSYITKSIKD